MTARWFSTLVAVREALYATKEAMSVAQLVSYIEAVPAVGADSMTNPKPATVRSSLLRLAASGKVKRSGDKWVHAFWYERGVR